MELREYWTILRRRWWLLVLLPLLVGLLSGLQLRPWQTPPPTYNATMRMLIGVLPLADADVTSYDPRYYAWLTSEYLVDDFTEVVRSELFTRAVNQRLADTGIEIAPSQISGSATTGKQHRIIRLSIGWGDPQQLEQIAAAAVAELEQNAAAYFQQLGTGQAVVTLLDPPVVAAVPQSLRNRLEFPLRVALAAVAGVVFAFALAYIDTSVRRREELEEMGLPVLGAIPRR